jgi:hypothetical protein
MRRLGPIIAPIVKLVFASTESVEPDRMPSVMSVLEDAAASTDAYFEALTKIGRAGLPLPPLLVCEPLIATARILFGMHS